MKTSRIQIVIPLLIILITAACTPSQQQAAPSATNTLVAVVQDVTQVPAQPTSEPVSGAAATETSEPERVIIPTSRGPNLVATDPSGVKLASGQLQLVEFFRFT